MMSKDLFIETINLMKKYHELTDKFCSVLEEMSPACYCDAFIYTEYEELILKYVSQYFDAQEMETIKYFMYDLNFGKDYKPGCFLYEDKEIDLSSVEKLYEYLEKYELNNW